MDSRFFSYGDSTKDLIYFAFANEYPSPNIPNFKTFIDIKDIGVKVINNHTATYEITDKHKWFLAKIKYGI